MISFRLFDLDEQGRPIRQDIRFDSRGNLALVSGGQAVMERVFTRVLLERGEDPFDNRRGLDYRFIFQNRQQDRALLLRFLESYLLQVEEVTAVSVSDLGVDRDTRRLTVSATITTQYGRFDLSI